MRHELSIVEINEKGAWSPALFEDQIVLTSNWLALADFLVASKPCVKGFEPGSDSYVTKSTHRLVRTKAFSSEFALIYPRGDAIVYLSPHAFEGEGLQAGDVLVVKDSNVGEVAIVPDGDWTKVGWSGGIAKLNIVKDRDYIIGFLKFGNFRRQVEAMTPRGATIKHAGDKWLTAKVPLPSSKQEPIVKEHISNLVQLSISLENELIKRANQIKSTVNNEIKSKQLAAPFAYTEPSVFELLESGRFDAAFHSKDCKRDIFLAKNYAGGWKTVKNAGFAVIPGPSLEIKIIKKRIDSNEPMEGYYRMFIPKNISEYGTMVSVPFMGTPAELPLLRKGDVIVGEAGFRKGRSYVFAEDPVRATTNAHGLIVRRDDNDLKKSVTFRCIFDWYRSTGLIDLLAVGGSGGHFSPSYFDLLAIPNFPEDVCETLFDFYIGPDFVARPLADFEVNGSFSQTEYSKWVIKTSKSLGILGLDGLIAKINSNLRRIFSRISAGKDVDLAVELKQLPGVEPISHPPEDESASQ